MTRGLGDAVKRRIAPSPRRPVSVSISFSLFVTSVLAATATEFAEFQAVGRGLLILGRHIVPTLTHITLKHYVIAWHN